VWWLALVVGLLVLATVSRVTYGGGPEVDRTGTASVRACTEQGPVSLAGFGIVHTCTAEIRWSDGDVQLREFPAGQLSPADIGRSVPVYLDIGDGRGGEPQLGRNGSARFAELRLPAVIALGFGVLVLGIGALYTSYRVARPESPGRDPQAAGRRRGAMEWRVSDGEVRAAPTPRLVSRLRLLSVWCLLVVAAVPLSTVPRFDAPRAEHFVSPWPRIERSLLVDVPATGAVIIGLVLAVLLYAMALLARQDAAKVVKYGPAYVGRNLRGKEPLEQQVAARMRALAAARRTSRVLAVVPGVLLLALAAWATIRALDAGPGSAPALVWLACVRDAVLLACLAVIWLSTAETRYQRLGRLLDQHREKNSASTGTAGWELSS